MSAIADTHLPRAGASHRWLVTATSLISSIAVTVTATIVNIAIPDIMGAFGISQITAQWMSTAFLASMTATMLMTDWLDKALGLRATFIAALAVFILGSFIGGFAPNEDFLILSRVMQGGAAGIVQPLSMVAMFRVFPPDQRGNAMGIFGLGVVLAPAIGPFAGGFLIDSFDWRYVFYVGIPFAVIGMTLAQFVYPARDPNITRPRFDWTGFALLVLALASLLTAFTNGQREGWGSMSVVMLFGTSFAATAGFIVWELLVREPLLDLRLFANFRFTSAAIVSFVFGAGIFATTYLVPLYVQTVQGLTPTQAGLLLMPGGLLLGAMFPLAGRLSDRVPVDVLIAFGLILIAFSALLTSRVDLDTGFWMLAAWVMIGRVGNAFIFPALSVGALRAVPPVLVAQASGTVNFMRQLGGAFGVNLLAVYLERRTQFFSNAMVESQTASNGETMELLARVRDFLAHAGLPDFQQMPGALQFLEQVVYTQANMFGFRDSFLVIAVVTALAIGPAMGVQRLRGGPRDSTRQ